MFFYRKKSSGLMTQEGAQDRIRPSSLRVFFRRLFLTLGFLCFVGIVVGLLAALANRPPTLPGKFVIAMKIDGDYPEYQPLDNPFGDSPPAFLDVINALDHATADNRVGGLVVDLESSDLSLGHIQELRAAVLRFKKGGKFAYIYAPSYGDPGRGLGLYYFVSAFDQVWMQPVGVLSISGMTAELPFARKLLDKFGVQPEFFQRKEYKSLFESFNNDHMSPQSHEEMTSLLTDLGGQFMTGIEQSKNIKPAALKAIVNQGIFTDQEALNVGLVNKLAGYDELKEKIAEDATGHKDDDKRGLKKVIAETKKTEKKIGNDKLFVDMDRYASDAAKNLARGSDKKTVALIYIDGTIADASESSRMPDFHLGLGDDFKPAQSPTDALLSASDDKSIAAIVLRINSPGGSPSAAETIRRAVLRAEAHGKKVTISMGDECASGGYWIAAAGTHIFADPGTLTGSIGVAGGKFNLAGFWAKYGVEWDAVSFGDNAGMLSFNHPLTPSETARMNDMMDSIYASFIARVAEGRHMTLAEAEAVSRGRVWTGAQAKSNGLVDDLGGLDAALDYMAQQLKVKNRAQLSLEIFPKPQSPIDKLEDLAGQVRGPGPLDSALAPVLQQLNRAALAGQYLTYAPVSVR